LRGDLYIHVATTVTEVVVGLLIGAVFGILAGLWFGRSPLLAGVMRPIIVAFYSVPLIALTPLFIMFFGLGMLPKIILVAIVVFFLLFFNTFAGAQEVLMLLGLVVAEAAAWLERRMLRWRHAAG